MFLGVMLGVSVFVPGVWAALNGMIDGIGSVAQNVNLDFATLWELLRQAITALDWNNPLPALETVLSEEWLNDVLTQILQAILGTDFETFAAQLAQHVDAFVGAVVGYTVLFAVFWALGYVAGYWLLKFLIRRDIARRALWKWLLATAFNSILSVATVVLTLWIFLLWQNSIFISVVVLLVLYNVGALVEAYLLQGYKKIRFDAVVNPKNIGLYMLANVLIFLISIACTLIAVAVNAFLGLFIGLTFLEIAAIVVDLNAEAYVKQAVDAKKTEAAAEVTENKADAAEKITGDKADAAEKVTENVADAAAEEKPE